MLPSYISAGCALGALILGILNRKKIQQVHVLVNNQLDRVMNKLESSQGQVKNLQKEKDDAKRDGK